MPNFAPKVILIGEKAVDCATILRPIRLNPEQPNTVVAKPVKETVAGGMAENVYNNLRSLGLKERDVCFVSNQTAIIKRRFIEEMTGSLIVRIDENDDVIEKQREYFDGDTFKDLKRVIEENKTVKMLVISDYCKGFIDEYWLEQVFNLCDKNGIKTIMDTRKKLGAWSEKVDFVKINNKEYKELGESSKYCRNMLVTLGERGIHWVNKDKIFSTKPVSNPVVCGAGDSTLAGFVYSYIHGAEIEDSIRYANKAGRVAVLKPGTVCVTQKEIEELD